MDGHLSSKGKTLQEQRGLQYGIFRRKPGRRRKGYGCAWLLRQKLWPFRAVNRRFMRTGRP
jgi:hypothetical protein